MEISDANSSMSIRVTPVQRFVTPVQRFSKRERFGRVPDSVANDGGLTLSDKAVYSALARHSFKDGNVYVGTRLLAEHLRTSHVTVSRSIKRLCSSGHIRVTTPGEIGRRAGYKLLSSMFSPREKQGREQINRQSVRQMASSWARTQEGRDSA